MKVHAKISFPPVRFSLPSAKAVISTAATAAMFVRFISREFVPDELRRYAIAEFRQFLSAFSSETTLVIEEYEGHFKNRLFHAAEPYVGSIAGPTMRSYRASLLERDKKVDLSLGVDEEIVDEFGGIPLKWKMVDRKIETRYVFTEGEDGTTIDEMRYLLLTFHKKHKKKVVDEYLPYVLERSEAIAESRKSLRLYTLNHDHSSRSSYPWMFMNLRHPAKFETLAMEDEVKNMVVDDLDMFLKRKEFYRKVGKAWKRGYLLYGPPGTGKSSLVAAMANYLNFDVYDLELSSVSSDSQLRELLMTTTNRSILVVEDIDASVDLTGRRGNRAPMPRYHQMYDNPDQQQQGSNKVTLSGLLNIIDGLWSSIGYERVIVFTTNHKDRLDPALLRPGRMDVHIHMSYCTPCGFKLLAKHYLGITEHPLVSKAEELIASCNVTPAEVVEQLLKSEDPVLALNGLIELLEAKMEEARGRAEEAGNRVRGVMEVARGASVPVAQTHGRRIGGIEAAMAFGVVLRFLDQQVTGNVEVEDDEESEEEKEMAEAWVMRRMISDGR